MLRRGKLVNKKSSPPRRLPPLLNYFGSKWSLAPLYPRPRHKVIIEPFAGGAGYSLLYPYLDVRLYDVDPIVCGVWEFLIHSTKEDIRKIPIVTRIEDMRDCCQEAKWLVRLWFAAGRDARGSEQMTPWAKKSPDYWGESCRERIAQSVVKIKHWKVSLLPFDQIGNCEATWFVDPPYQGPCGDGYRFRDVDYDFLGKWCKARSGQVIACEQQGANWLPFVPFKKISGMTVAANGGKKTMEVCWNK